MSQYVTDTHALSWHFSRDKRLSPPALRIFQQVDAGQVRMLVPGIVLIEMVYLAEKGRLSTSQVDHMLALFDPPGSSYTLAMLDQHIARVLRLVPRALVAELHDRLIVATALHLNVPLITRDTAIQQAGLVPVIW